APATARSFARMLTLWCPFLMAWGELYHYHMQGPALPEASCGELPMHLLTRFCVMRWLLLCTLLQLPVLFARASAQEKAAQNDVSPWQRVLKGEDAKRVEELQKKLEELRQTGKFTDAHAAARTVLEIRRRVQGEGHWETRD